MRLWFPILCKGFLFLQGFSLRVDSHVPINLSYFDVITTGGGPGGYVAFVARLTLAALRFSAGVEGPGGDWDVVPPVVMFVG